MNWYVAIQLKCTLQVHSVYTHSLPFEDYKLTGLKVDTVIPATSKHQFIPHYAFLWLIQFEDCELIGIKVAEWERERERQRERILRLKCHKYRLFPYCCTLSLKRLWVWQWFPTSTLLESLHHLVHLHVFSSLDSSQTCKVRFMILLLITTESLEKLKGCNKDRAITLIISLKCLSFSGNTLPNVLSMKVK